VSSNHVCFLARLAARGAVSKDLGSLLSSVTQRPIPHARAHPKDMHLTRPTGKTPVTIKDIAGELGLAHSTVSRALNDHPHINAETKVKVRAAAIALGYVANSGARLLRAGASQLVGLIVPDIENEFYGTAARILSEQCSKQGYQLVLAVSGDDPEREAMQVRALREARVAGVLITPTAKPKAGAVDNLGNLATVQFLRRYKPIAGHSVGVDDAQGVALATEHLLGLGHRRIGYIGVSEQLSTGRERASGYRRALTDRRIAVDESLLCHGPSRPHFGREAFALLLSANQPPSALVIASPRHIIGVLDEANARRIQIPIELSIVAYSDAEWFRVCRPSVSAVELPVAEMAATAASLLFRLIVGTEDTGTDSHVSFAPRLNARQSSAAPPPARTRSRN
jgi:LacI family transcriptional regulator